MIRPATLADIPAITAICNHYIEHSTAVFDLLPTTEEERREHFLHLTAEGCPYFVCTEGTDIVGYCYAHPWKTKAAYRTTWETSLYLSHAHCGKGFGRALLQTLIDASRARSCHRLIACITDDNAVSIRLHEAFGFRRVSHFTEVGYKFDRWLGIVDYQYDL